MQGRKRIAFYGGTFDPVHLGHLAVAKETLKLFEFDQLFFLPARQAPHKLERDVTSPLHRYAMLTLATEDEPQLLVSTVELELPDRHYTVDTLDHFRAVFGETAQLFFVMGADSWSDITTWREWRRLLTMANHVVVTRPGHPISTDHPPNLASQVVDVRGWDSQTASQALSEASVPKVFITDVAMMDISATAVRDAARAGSDEQLKKLVPERVANYITKYELYKNSNET
jgi:nicotinate-nucleotide adenylyltransferase